MSESVHERLIRNDCIKIFEFLLHANQVQDNSVSQLLSLVSLGLNAKNFYLIESEVNMVNQLSLIDECERPLQIALLSAAVQYVLDTAYERRADLSKH